MIGIQIYCFLCIVNQTDESEQTYLKDSMNSLNNHIIKKPDMFSGTPLMSYYRLLTFLSCCGYLVRWIHKDGDNSGQSSLVLLQRLSWFWFLFRGRADKQTVNFQKASYRKSLVKDDVYGETLDEEYTLNYWMSCLLGSWEFGRGRVKFSTPNTSNTSHCWPLALHVL